jgi:4-hydroxybenzoate polyprenyltransferase
MDARTDSSRNLFSKVLDFYLFSNLHIALCAAALVGVTQQLFGFHLRSELYVFVFCGTFFLYNLQRLPAAFHNAEIERTFIRHRWNTEHRKLLLGISIIAMIAAAWAFFQLYRRTQLIALIPAALSVAYAFPAIYWKKRWIKLREIPMIKIFIVGLVWGMSCVWVPAAADNSFPQWTSPEVTLWMIACSIMIFSITIPFDIRDLPYDGHQLKTLPAFFGVRKAIAIAIAGMLLSFVGVWLADTLSTIVEPHHVLAYGVWTLITCVVIAFSKPTRHEYYYSLLVDGLMMVLWAMMMVMN